MGNKQEELEAIVHQGNHNIIAIMEIWWDDLHDLSVAMNGYRLFKKERSGGEKKWSSVTHEAVL